MAFAETANLIARLSLKDEFSRPLRGIKGALSGTTAQIAKGVVLGQNADRALRAGVRTLFGAVEGGLSSLADLEDATISVDAAIKQMGFTGQVTSNQISGWANEIEKNVDAAFDDKAITQSATTLIRYGKLVPANLKQALEVETDLAAKTGDIGSASALLAKALANPAKAAGRLARAGVILTQKQQDEIKTMTDAGDAAGAQKVLLDALTQTVSGAAKAMHGPYRDSQLVLRDVTEDAQKALATGFLPVLEKVRGILSTELAKPGTLENIKRFGEGLAGGLGNLIDIARGLPWGAIGDALKIGGAGAKVVLDAFTAMPPWVQTAIATSWGLNKLTGGAVSGIIGQVASGLIKGVLGIQAGVVNINAGVVNGAGGVPGAGVAGAAKGGLGLASKLFLVGEAIGLIAAVNAVRDTIAGELTQQTKGIHDAVSNQINDQKSTSGQLAQSLAGVNQGIEALSHDPIGNALLGDQLGELQKMRDELGSALKAQDDTNKSKFRDSERNDKSSTTTTKQAIDSARDKIEASRIALSSKTAAVKTSIDRDRDAVESARIAIRSTEGTVRTGSQSIVSALGSQRMSATLPIQIYVNGVLTKTTTQETTLASNTGHGSTTVPGHSGI